MTEEATITEETTTKETPPTAGQQLIEEIDNFLKTVTTRHNIPATEIQDHLLDIRAIAQAHTN
jgi:hypothetical protein